MLLTGSATRETSTAFRRSTGSMPVPALAPVMASKPPCMDADDWREWSRLNSGLPDADRAQTACVDCTPAWRRAVGCALAVEAR